MLFLTPFITAYGLILAFILGAVFASFLGCMGWRLCKNESILKGRSHCDFCDHVLKAHDLIPVFSYIMRKGRCKYCNAKIPPLNFYGEIVLAVLFVLTVLRFDISIPCVLMLFFLCILYLVSVTDLYDQIIPDGCLITAIVVRVIYFCFVEGFQWRALFALLGNGFAVSLPLLFLVLLMEKVWKKEAMGGGDIKLLFVTGMYIGWAQNLLAVFLACIIGIVVGLRQTKKEESNGYFPFGPSIAIGAAFSMLYGTPLLEAYMSLF